LNIQVYLSSISAFKFIAIIVANLFTVAAKLRPVC
jgi:hypothetical protein